MFLEFLLPILPCDIITQVSSFPGHTVAAFLTLPFGLLKNFILKKKKKKKFIL